MSKRPPSPIPELLAPAGDKQSLLAAMAAGADAVYFGLTDFNARARASNFTPEELPDVMELLRSRNVRGYVALNTLVFTEELERAARLLRGMGKNLFCFFQGNGVVGEF